jgi:hypothetical protein
MAMGLVRGWRRRDGEAASAEAAAAPPGASDVAGDGSIEAAGYLMTAQTCEAVGKVSLLEAASFACPVLVIDRDDVSGSERWIEKMQAAGTPVERRALPGFLAMMRDPAYAQVPTDMVEAIVAWALGCQAPRGDAVGRDRGGDDSSAGAPANRAGAAQPGAASSRAVVVPASDDGVAVLETLFVREDDGLQFGVLSEPMAPRSADASPPPALLLVNSGAVHHVGPNRLYVPLARHFAGLGFVVLRVDLSGLGDSEPHAGEPAVAPYTPRGVRDIERWLAHLKRHARVGDCHLMGICSGGFQVFSAAREGLPFAKVLSLNPVNFYWTEGMQLDVPLHDLNHQVVRIAAGYRKSLLDPQKWRKLLAGEVDLALAMRVTRKRVSGWTRHRVRSIGRALHVPLKNDLGADLRRICESPTRLELIFSHGDPGLSILREQAGSMVDKLCRAGRLVILDVPGADHTFSSQAARVGLQALLTERLAATAPRAAVENAA